MPASSPGLSSIDLDLVAVRLGPAHVHAQQHLRPVLALGAAGAGVDLEIGVVGVGLAREQRLEPALGGVGPSALRSASSASASSPGVALRLGELDQADGVVELALERL